MGYQKKSDVSKNESAIKWINEHLLLEQRKNIHIALEDINFCWDREELIQFDQMWNQGSSIYQIAGELDREDVDEIVILALDRSRDGFILPRPGGLFGRKGNGMKGYTSLQVAILKLIDEGKEDEEIREKFNYFLAQMRAETERNKYAKSNIPTNIRRT